MRAAPTQFHKKLELSEATELYEQSVHLAKDYLQGRGFTDETISSFRLGYVAEPARGHENYRGRLAIPSLGPRGDVRSLRFRCLLEHNCHEVGCPKYLGIDGMDTRIFNARAVEEGGEVLVVTEGEVDAISVNQAGVPAIGICGANGWKPHYRRLLEGFRVLVVGDNDDAGRQFVKKVTGDLVSASGVTLDPAVGDLNELLVKSGEAAIREALGVDDER